jgi:hypothetical protein
MSGNQSSWDHFLGTSFLGRHDGVSGSRNAHSSVKLLQPRFSDSCFHPSVTQIPDRENGATDRHKGSTHGLDLAKKQKAIHQSIQMLYSF